MTYRTSVLILLIVSPWASAQPIPPTRLKLDGTKTAAALFDRIEKQTGLKIQAGTLNPASAFIPPAAATFWSSLESLADQTGTRLIVNGANRSISFAKGPAKTAASLDDAFRVAVQGVSAKLDGATGEVSYSLALDVHWEPRFPVFRIDAQPRVSRAVDDRGTALTVKTASVKGAVAGYSHVADVRIDGLARPAKSIAAFDGEFTVTASPKMLAFEFADLTKLPATVELDGVKATLQPVKKRDEVWELSLVIAYPADPPAFESFESWTNRNALRLLAPNGRVVAEPENQDAGAVGRTVRAAYRYAFKAADLSNREGWKVVYEAPAPLVEFPVKFRLKEIPLP
ncbi:MAG: hypothetical protein JNK93_01925 [Planctomycetia bacterium]|nr:hypothetical protein [Planctomycetia bacterium]